MYSFDLLIPWLSLAATLIPLLYVQRWIHRHLFGMGYLLAKDKGTATLFYYLLLAPGVILHEFSEYMMAGVFGVHARKFNFVPEAQEDGSLEFGFIQLEEVKNPVWGSIIGLAPLLFGLAAVIFISTSLLNLPEIFTAIRINDMTVIGAALNKLIHKPDFLLWFYVLFAIANTMMPGKEARRAWWILVAVAGAIFLYFTVIGLQQVIVNWMNGPISHVLYELTSVFGMVLGLNLFVAGIIWTIEFIVERATGHRVEYAPALTAGNAAALPAPLPKSVYDLRLPIPAAPGKAPAKPAAKGAKGSEKLPAGAPAKPAPALGSSTAAKPAFGTGPRPAPKPGSPAPTSGEKPAERPAVSTGTVPGGVRPGATAAATPGKPAASTGAQPAKPISGPPALARPTTPQPSAAKRPTPAPKPGAAPGSARPASPFGSARKDDDYIDADVIDEDDEDDKPAFGKKPASKPPTGRSMFDRAARDDEDDEE